MRRVAPLAFAALLLGSLGCGSLLYDATLASRMTTDMAPQGADGDSYARVMQVLEDEGFEIVRADRQSGVLTTDFRSVPSPQTLWPLKYYLKVRIELRGATGGVALTIKPTVRAVHRVVRTMHRDYPVLELNSTDGHVDGSRLDEAKSLDAAAAEYHHLIAGIARALGIAESDIKSQTAKFKRANMSNPFR